MANKGEEIFNSKVWMGDPRSQYNVIDTQKQIPITFTQDKSLTIWGNNNLNSNITVPKGNTWYIVGRDNSAYSGLDSRFIIKNEDGKYAAVRWSTEWEASSPNPSTGDPFTSAADYASYQLNTGFMSTDDYNDYNKFIMDSDAVIEDTRQRLAGEKDQTISQSFDDTKTSFGEYVVTPITNKIDTTEISVRMEPTIWTFGLPPQWTKYVDPRVMGFTTCQNTGYGSNGPTIPVGLGRRYAGVTISNPTVLEIAPGFMRYAEWMAGSDTFTNAVNEWKEDTGGNVSTLIAEFNSHSSKFYTIKPCFNTGEYSVAESDDRRFKFGGYIDYVKYLMIIASVFLSRSEAQRASGSSTVNMAGTTYKKFHSDGVVELAVPPLSDRQTFSNLGKYKEINWQFYDKHSGYLTIGGVVLGATGGASNGDTSSNAHESQFDYVKFYLSGSTSAQDSFSTDVEDSILGQLASTVNMAMKEAAYWMGSPVGDIVDNAVSTLSGIMDATKFKGSNPLAGIFNTQEVLGGGKIVFPQIITNSKYGKSIECECTFASIYGDEEALFINTIMPYMHLLAFVLPHQVRTSLEMYTFPFIVKAFCRGLFNVEMGAITSFSVNRGGGDNALWSFNGAAEIVTVNFEITPLINNLVMTSAFDGVGWLLRNTGLQEYMSAVTAFDARNDNFELAYDIITAGIRGGTVSKLTSVLTPLMQSELVSSIIDFSRKVESYSLTPGETVRGIVGSVTGGIEDVLTPKANADGDQLQTTAEQLYNIG